jgi:hypothetical protein
MARENGWGAPRIHGELLKLGLEVDERTVSRYLPRGRTSPDKLQRWLVFLRNHRDALVGTDFFTVPTVTFEYLEGVCGAAPRTTADFAFRGNRPSGGAVGHSTTAQSRVRQIPGRRPPVRTPRIAANGFNTRSMPATSSAQSRPVTRSVVASSLPGPECPESRSESPAAPLGRCSQLRQPSLMALIPFSGFNIGCLSRRRRVRSPFPIHHQTAFVAARWQRQPFH